MKRLFILLGSGTAAIAIAVIACSPLLTPAISTASEVLFPPEALTVIDEESQGIVTKTDEESGITRITYTDEGIANLKKESESEASLMGLDDDEVLPSSYSGKITSIKNQYQWNWCASFAMIAALETASMNTSNSDIEPNFDEAALAISNYTAAQKDGQDTGTSDSGCYAISGNFWSVPLNYGANAHELVSTLASGQVGLIEDTSEIPVTPTSEAAVSLQQQCLSSYSTPRSTILKTGGRVIDYMVESSDTGKRTFYPDLLQNWKKIIKQYEGACTLAFDAVMGYNYFYDSHWSGTATYFDSYADLDSTTHVANHEVQVYGYDDNASRYLFTKKLDGTTQYDDTISSLVYVKNDGNGNPLCSVLCDINGVPNEQAIKKNVITENVTGEQREGYTLCVVPKKDGAWLIKNSWGNTDHRQGSSKSVPQMEYISYYDKTIVDLYYYETEQKTAATELQYNRLFSSLLKGDDLIGGNVFTIKNKTKIENIGVNGFSYYDIKYTVKIYRNLSNPNDPTSGELVDTLTVSGTDYMTAALEHPFIAENEQVGVTITALFSSDDGNTVIPFEANSYSDGSSTGTTYCAPGESFYKEAGMSQWRDVTAESADEGIKDCNISVKLIVEKLDDIDLQVSFDANGGTGSMDSIAITETDKFSVPSSKFQKTGYAFASWNTSSDGTGISYLPGDEIIVTEPITLYAIWQKKFTDVNENAWYYEPVTRIAALGLMSGYGNGAFGPNDNMTRAQLAVVLYNYFGTEKYSSTENQTGLSDVLVNQYYTAAANWAVKNGIITGLSGKYFAPNNSATREQACVIIARAAQKFCNANIDNVDKTKMKQLQKNGHGTVSSWAENSVAWCINNKILNGVSGKWIMAGQALTRAQAASMIMNAIDNGAIKK